MPGEAAAIKAGEAFIEIGSKIGTAFHAGLRKAEREMVKWGATLGGIGASITAPLTAAMSKFTSYADDMAKMGRRTGLSAEAVSELGYVANLAGSNVETLEMAVRVMQRTIGDASVGLEESARNFRMLGLQLADLQKLDSEEQFLKIGEALGQLTDDTQQAYLAQKLFGRGGTAMIPMFEMGAEAMEVYRKQGARLIGMSNEMAVTAEEARDAWYMFKQGLLGMAIAAAKPLTEAMLKLRDIVLGGIIAVREWIAAHPEAVKWVYKLGTALTAAGAALLGMAAATKVLNMLFSPGGVIVAAAAGLLYLLDSLEIVDLGFKQFVQDVGTGGGKLGEWFRDIGVILGDTFSIAWASIKSGFKILMAELGKMFLEFTAWLGDKWTQLKLDWKLISPEQALFDTMYRAQQLQFGKAELTKVQIEEREALAEETKPLALEIGEKTAKILTDMKNLFTEGLEIPEFKWPEAPTEIPDMATQMAGRLSTVSARAFANAMIRPPGGFGAALAAPEGARFQTSLALSEKAASEQTARAMLDQLRVIAQNTKTAYGVYG